MTYFLTILLWAFVIYGAYIIFVTLLTMSCVFSLLCISHSKENVKELVKELHDEMKYNQIWFRFAWINWYGPLAVLQATLIVVRRVRPTTPFDGLNANEINETVNQIRFAVDNGTPQDLPVEIREWGFDGNRMSIRQGYRLVHGRKRRK